MSDHTEVITIVGKRGQGKTTLAKSIIQRRQNDGSLIFVFDYVGEYDGQVFTDRRALDLGARRPFLYRGTDDHFFADTVYQAGKTGRPVLCVLDEVDIFGKHSWPLAWLYRYGRHRNISIVAIARRFYDLPPYIRALTGAFKVFQITDERDLTYLQHAQNKPTAALARSLRPHTFITIQF